MKPALFLIATLLLAACGLAPQIDPQSVIGQVCPGDRVVVLRGRQVGSAIWYEVLLEGTTEDCVPEHVPYGATGWLHSTLLNGPSEPVEMQ
jgi:hypothetical protein